MNEESFIHLFLILAVLVLHILTSEFKIWVPDNFFAADTFPVLLDLIWKHWTFIKILHIKTFNNNFLKKWQNHLGFLSIVSEMQKYNN